MTENGLPAGTPSGEFDAAEQNFFREGEALESSELLMVDELTDQRRRLPRAWWPRLLLMGAGGGLALLVLTLAGGRTPAGDAVAAVSVAQGPSLPVTQAASPALPAPAIEARPAPRVKAIKHAHRRQPAHGKRR
jgi:hypothetical protein